MLGFAPIAALAIAALPDFGTPVSQSGSCAVEWLAGTMSSQAIPMEHMQGGLVTAAAVVPFESVAQRVASLVVGDERLAGRIVSGLIPMEHLGPVIAVSQSAIISIEWRSGRLRSGTVDWERKAFRTRSGLVAYDWILTFLLLRFEGAYLSGSRFMARYRSGQRVPGLYLSGPGYSGEEVGP